MTDEPELCPHCGQPMPPLKPWASEDDVQRQRREADEAQQARQRQAHQQIIAANRPFRARREAEHEAEHEAALDSIRNANVTKGANPSPASPATRMSMNSSDAWTR